MAFNSRDFFAGHSGKSRVGKIALNCSLGHPITAQGSVHFASCECEVKMAGYWPSSFFASLWTETNSRFLNSQKKNEANIHPS